MTTPPGPHTSQTALEIARIVREACIQAATEGYEQAATSGLCDEGALEAAIGAIRMLNLETVLAQALQATEGNDK